MENVSYIIEQVIFTLIPVLSGFFFMYWIFVWIVRIVKMI